MDTEELAAFQRRETLKQFIRDWVHDCNDEEFLQFIVQTIKSRQENVPT